MCHIAVSLADLIEMLEIPHPQPRGSRLGVSQALFYASPLLQDGL